MPISQIVAGGISGGAAGALAGLLGQTTASFFRLVPPLYMIPFEPLADVLPGITPFRTTLSMIDSEAFVKSYRITTNTLQDFTDTTPNVHRELTQLTITGTMSSSLPFSPLQLPSSIAPPVPGNFLAPTFGFRMDLLQIANLERIADRREPVMVITPRVSLAQCFIQSIQRPWTPADGEATAVVITVIEARLASPFTTELVSDQETLVPGNDQAVGGGEQSTTPSNATVSAPATAQVSPQSANRISA